jgi:hypothetical protein
LEGNIISTRKKDSRLFRFTIPKRIIVYGVVIFCIFVVAGGIYDILENPRVILQLPSGQWVTLHPSLNDQTLYESIFVMITYSMMFGGLILAYRSTKIAYDRKKANFRLIIGLIFAIAGFAGNMLIIFLK